MDLAGSLKLAVLAVGLEAFLGYPQGLFRATGHPVTWAGGLISLLDARLNRESLSSSARRVLGFAAIAILLGAAFFAAWLAGVSIAALNLPQPASLALTALIASSLIAQKSLHEHVMEVACALDTGLEQGRAAVSKIVGRDVNALDESGVASAAIESLAENFSDGAVAPAFWLALGGLPAGFCYKALNTADSMIGHRTERHTAFGFAAAKFDDLANLLPARLSGLWLVLAAFLVPQASAGEAWRTLRRDARKHASPNAGWPEAAAAGALRLRLGGLRSYGGVPFQGAEIGSGRKASASDIRRALVLYRRACVIHWGALALAALAIAQA
ncbi:MAG TPA: adenosylcobinamide-phosphate synthase CbiB [Methylocella sp.]|nr:adenosylcobinamide-phosphate synthase CbiB [Methylocella sp.]